MALLEVDDLRVAIGALTVLQHVSFEIGAGETLALVGESGSGKSLTALTLMRLLPPAGRIVSGTIRLEGRDLAAMTETQMSGVRGSRMAMVFQEPMSSMNPLLTIGAHVMEPLRLHGGLSRRQARAQAIALLDRVGIPSAATRVDDYPHRLSGGMRQRVMIASALACKPALLIADEPTTALDVTIQAQIMELLADLQSEFGMGMLFITHDLGVVAEYAHRVAVMYAGRMVESASTLQLFSHAAHPYTAALLECVPDGEDREYLAAIQGVVPALDALPPGCRFEPRCRRAIADCRRADPPFAAAEPGHLVACIHQEEARA
ncbi:ABC transporter ATP-binding protein [Verticiella sediminum]|uniref:ABC transporter ATP-binding protein n=2 Tax=Verticiella sediminum TaxID=1247510 RepID=A0A556A8F0_9BURK|nr:ABC transporter ATP-binding protein [Verticiella sediminum]